MLRAEISCPREMEGGFFTDFSKRIILIGEGFEYADPMKRDLPDDDRPDFDISVTRK